jgi:hypothetical protein
MIDKASPAGCVVQVTVPALIDPGKVEAVRWIGPTLPGAPSFKYFNVAIAAHDKAIEATMKHLAKGEAMDGEMSVVRALSPGEVAALHLKAGEVKLA